MAQLQPVMFPEIEGPDFVRSSEVAEVADDVLSIHARNVGRLAPVADAIEAGEVHVLWLLNTKPFDELNETRDHDTAGKCIKAPALWRDVTGYHVAIWLREHFWKEWDEATRRAAVLHELLHVDVDRDKDGKAKVRIRKHDVESFVDVVRHYGPIEGDGARLVRAAATFAGEPALLRPLQDVADRTGAEITLEAQGRKATLRPRKVDGRTVDPETGEVLEHSEDGEA